MEKYVKLDDAIAVLTRMKAEREKKSCNKSALYEAGALGYAIAILKQLPVYEKE